MPAESNRRLLVVQVAALAHDLAAAPDTPTWRGGSFHALAPTFPALTCPVQAGMRTATPPSQHGMIANGLFFRNLRKAMFWEQSSRLIEGPRIWDAFRARGGTVGMLFWQQSLGETVDIVVSPQPVHRHGGGMIESCYSSPSDLYSWLCAQVGAPFRLARYWGPLADHHSSGWIAQATASLLRDTERRPDLCFTYLPALDYDLQRHGPDGPAAQRALQKLFEQLDVLYAAADGAGYEMLIYGDYAIENVRGDAIFPNRILRSAGLFASKDVRGMAYPDLHAGRAFAMVDHAIAHIYVQDTADLPRVAAIFEGTAGIDRVCGAADLADLGVAHTNSGELVLIAESGRWFAYPWWQDPREAPDFDRHIDIHNKPGYDPCELFFGWPPLTVSRKMGRVRGTHGRANHPTAWAATPGFVSEAGTLEGLACSVRDWIS